MGPLLFAKSRPGRRTSGEGAAAALRPALETRVAPHLTAHEKKGAAGMEYGLGHGVPLPRGTR